MPFSLRRRQLTCFYCGSRTSQTQTSHARQWQWQCEHCDAVNHIDKQGQITEPPSLSPTTNTPPAPRFAHIPNRSSSPPSFSQETLFCATCLKNQHLLTETLATYLPSTDDPQYAEYERSYPAYRAKLEQRYPQVCRNCLPAVKDRIRKAGYVAKTDHLRRMVEQTRRNGISSRPNLGWRGLLLRVGGLGWAASLILQGSWHLLGCLPQPKTLPLDIGGGDGPAIAQDSLVYDSRKEMLVSCARHVAVQRQIQPECFQEATALVSWALMLAALTIWWNDKLRRKYETTGARMTGLTDFYVLQSLVFLVRVAVYWVLRDLPITGLPESALHGAHAFMALCLLLLVPASLSIVKVGRRQMIKFHSDEDLLVLPDTADDSNNFSTPVPNRITTAHYTTPRPFPIDNLASTDPARTFPTPLHQTPTPPPEDDEDEAEGETDAASETDAMDWTPTANKTFRLTPRSTTSSRFSLSAQKPPPAPSPFYGTLPKAPIPPAHKLRNPIHTTPPFHKASKETQQTFFAGLTTKRGSPAARPTDNLTADDNEPGEFKMAPPRLFLQQDQLETGLEAIFDEVFSIREVPNEVRDGRREDAMGLSGAVHSHDAAGREAVSYEKMDSRGWTTVLTMILVPVCILLGVAAWVKSRERAQWVPL